MSDNADMAVRKTTRSTAGQHLNISHLPRPVRRLEQGTSASSDPISQSVHGLLELVSNPRVKWFSCQGDDARRGGRLWQEMYFKFPDCCSF